MNSTIYCKSVPLFGNEPEPIQDGKLTDEWLQFVLDFFKKIWTIEGNEHNKPYGDRLAFFLRNAPSIEWTVMQVRDDIEQWMANYVKHTSCKKPTKKGVRSQ